MTHTEKKVRDRGFKDLKAWLQRQPDLQRLDYMKLWKALYFCMWMSDKRPVQQELCVHIAWLLNDIPSEKQFMWLDCFWETMEAHWGALDKHRVNKYLLLVRIILAEAFKCLRTRGWKTADAKAMCQIVLARVPEGPARRYATNIPCPTLILHFARVFWSELGPQLGWEESAADRAPSEAVMELLEPMIQLAEDTGAWSLAEAIHRYILRAAPTEIKASIVERVLAGAARPGIADRNREAMYETADMIEGIDRNSNPVRKRPSAASKAHKKGVKERKKSEVAKAADGGGNAGGDATLDASAAEAEPRSGAVMTDAAVGAHGATRAGKKRPRVGDAAAHAGSDVHGKEEDALLAEAGRASRAKKRAAGVGGSKRGKKLRREASIVGTQAKSPSLPPRAAVQEECAPPPRKKSMKSR